MGRRFMRTPNSLVWNRSARCGIFSIPNGKAKQSLCGRAPTTYRRHCFLCTIIRRSDQSFLNASTAGGWRSTFFIAFCPATDWLAAGKYQICVLCRLRRAAEQGLPVVEVNPYQFKEAPGIGSNNGAIVLMNNHPHPNAAKVFINWYLSREGQIAFRMANNTQE